MYTIQANNKTYIVSTHAASRMLRRAISEPMVIETLEQGIIIEQPHNTDLYEYELYDALTEEVVRIQVIVDEINRTIVTVIDAGQ